jgi:hypothetical protein
MILLVVSQDYARGARALRLTDIPAPRFRAGLRVGGTMILDNAVDFSDGSSYCAELAIREWDEVASAAF